MKKTILAYRLLLVLILAVMGSTYAYAEIPKVVVIPLGADALPSGVLSERETVMGETKTVVAGGSVSYPVNCTSGKVIIGGGYSQTNILGVPISANQALTIVNNYPQPNGTSWRVYARNEQAAATLYFRAYAVCARES